MTNGDFIRSLSNAELAHELMTWIIVHRPVIDDRYLEAFILYHLEQTYRGGNSSEASVVLPRK